jgi:lipid-A-disaccharide synthase
MALRRIQRRADDIAALARRTQPDLAVLIDSWGFSLRVAQRLRKLSPKIQIVKYVGPQVWASRPGRARTLAGAVDHLLSTQQMDAPFYAGLPLRVTFVGDPALNRDLGDVSGARARASLGLAKDQPVLLVLPGSRPAEIARLAEPFGEAAARLSAMTPGLAVVVPVASTVREQVKAAVAGWSTPVILVEDDDLKYDTMAGCTAALAASGTVATELALCGAPMVIGYRIGELSYAVLRRLMRARFVTLFNIAADKEIAPERLQADCTGERLAQSLSALFKDPRRRTAQIADQNAALKLMGRGQGDPSERAALAILGDLEAQKRLRPLSENTERAQDN